MLLMAASLALRNHVALESSSGPEPAVLAEGSQHTDSRQPQSSQGGRVDSVAALDSILSLLAALVTGGPWWQEAKAHHALLLLETLSMVHKVSMWVMPVWYLLTVEVPEATPSAQQNITTTVLRIMLGGT
jgi:hypothetical protein